MYILNDKIINIILAYVCVCVYIYIYIYLGLGLIIYIKYTLHIK